MKPFTFPAWVEQSPSLFYLYFGPRVGSATAGTIAYKGVGLVCADIDAQGPFWRASGPVSVDGGWECRDLGRRFASAEDAKLAVEQDILAAGDGRYTVPLPENTISVCADGTLQVDGRLFNDPVLQERLRAAAAQVLKVLEDARACASLNEMIAALRRTRTAPDDSAPPPNTASTLQ